MIIAEYTDFMNIALEEARTARAEGEVPIGAALAADGRLIARAHNMIEGTLSASRHAELIVLEKGAGILKRRNLSDCVLFSTLEPCAMCAGAIIGFNVKTVVFGAYDERYGCLFSKTDLPKLMGRSIRVIGGICEYEAKALLNGFFAEHRN